MSSYILKRKPWNLIKILFCFGSMFFPEVYSSEKRSFLSGNEERGSHKAQLVKNPPAMQESLVQFLGQENPWRRDRLLPLLLLLLRHFSRVRLCVTPQRTAHQALPSLGFSRQEHWSGLPFPSPMHESEKWKWSRSVLSNSSQPHGLQPTRLLHPWDFPGKSTGVGCHCLLLVVFQLPSI